MARIEVVMPQMGESIAEGTIVKWHKSIGDKVKKDETILEISTDKVDSEIPSPASGVLAEILVKEQETVPVQTVIAYLETDAGAAISPPEQKSTPKNTTDEPTERSVAPPAVPAATARSVEPQLSTPASGRFYSPLVLNIARTEKISMQELERIPGTGQEGRVSRKDMFAYVEAKKAGKIPPAMEPREATATHRPAVGLPSAKVVDTAELRQRYPAPLHEILQMSNVQQKMADHMLRSVQTSPHVAAIHEVDMTNVVNHRASHAGEFLKAEGYKLTFTPYIVQAVVRAIKKYPLINSSLEGDKIIKKSFINLGIAVASENGLIVPVIKNAEEKNFLGLARAVNDLAVRTRTKKLTPDDIQNGTFTISNYGVFGTMIGTPIISQPQVAILGTGAITKRPVVIDDMIAIRSMAYFTMSFDHRLVDGALGGMFLDEVVQFLQNYDVNSKL